MTRRNFAALTPTVFLLGALLTGWVANAASRGAEPTRVPHSSSQTPSPKPNMRVGAAQPKARLIDYQLQDPSAVLVQVEKSLGELEHLVHKAGTAKCAALAFPEDTLGLGNWEAANKGSLKDVLPAAAKRMLERLGQAAAAHRMYLICCTDTVEADGAVHNTAFFLGRDGREIGRYHKVNMPIHELDKKRSNRFPVFQTPDLGGVGMLICYDMVFPEAPRCLALAGADIIFHPTLGGAAIGDDDISRAAFRTRAVENFVYLVVSQRGGGSIIVSPQGKVLAEGKKPDDVVLAEIDPFGGREGGDAMNEQRDMRARLFRERSPAAFGILIDPNPPVLTKVPLTITVQEAVRISTQVLTSGESRFQEAEALLRAGKTEEAIEAFKKLSAEFPQSWIDRAARERLRAIPRPFKRVPVSKQELTALYPGSARSGGNFTRGSANAVKFGTHEIVLTGNATVKNPFDTLAQVHFTPPSGPVKRVTVRAFYDGGNTWRARLYVTQTGKWTWASTCASDPGLSGKSGSFTAVDSNLRGMLRKHKANPRTWMTDDGRWFVGISDTAWLLFNRDPQVSRHWKQFVRDDVAQGVNVLGPVGSLESWGTGDVAHPGNNEPWVEGKETDYTRYDLAKFQNAESRLIWIFDNYPHLYIQSMLLGMQLQSRWLRLPPSVRANTMDYLIARWSAFPNLFWLISEDQDSRQADTLAFNREVGKYFAAHEPWKHLLSTQINRFQGFPLITPDDLEWVSYIEIQDANAPGADQIKKYRVDRLPVHALLGEDYYEQDYGSPPSGKADPRFYYRWTFWSWILSGGSANYGGRYGVIHPYSQTGRRDLEWVGPGGTRFTGHQLKGLDSAPYILPYFEKRHIDLAYFQADDERVIDLDGRKGQRRPKLMRRGQDEFLVYHPNAASEGNGAQVDKTKAARLRLDVKSAPGTFAVEWYRPYDGVAQRDGRVEGGAVREFVAPWPGYDAVLRLLSLRDARPKGPRKLPALSGPGRDTESREVGKATEQARVDVESGVADRSCDEETFYPGS